MSRKLIRELISILGLKVECPNCGDSFPIRRSTLFGMHEAYPPAAQKIIRRRLQTADEMKAEIRERTEALAVNRKQM
jgi:hypothetical protein